METSWPTLRQTEALRAVAAFQEEHGYPATYRELCDALSLSNPSSTYMLLTELEDRGLVRIMRGKNRAVSVTPRGRGWLQIDAARSTSRVNGV